ncbi:hypothetical protein PPYR_15590 [Photinus pyralis]|uniref:Uncharacterized protein n=1 Tax=Photinus pyralis TaxID=7054 RepID=A0A5N3ZYF9_PHOPY|nr:hypothetical protein PPYR_15590 [Photinus pyralis]
MHKKGSVTRRGGVIKVEIAVQKRRRLETLIKNIKQLKFDVEMLEAQRKMKTLTVGDRKNAYGLLMDPQGQLEMVSPMEDVIFNNVKIFGYRTKVKFDNELSCINQKLCTLDIK